MSTPRAEEAAASLRHPLTLTLLALTFSTGTVDAVSYLALGHVFTANMTGNIVLLGFGIARRRPAGAGTGDLDGRVRARERVRRDPGAPPGRPACGAFSYALGLESLALGIATIIAAVAHPHSGRLSGYAMIVCMAMGMGLRTPRCPTSACRT